MTQISYPNKFLLKGKVAIVTGGVGIIGTELCKGFAQMGAHLAIFDLNSDELKSKSSELENSYGIKCLGVACDVSSQTSVEKAVEETQTKLGKIHVLINAAASKTEDLTTFFASTEKYALETWRKVMAVNLDGMFLVAKTVGAAMQKAKVEGSIIQFSSIYGSLGPDNRIYEGSQYMGQAINTPAVYAASKGGVNALTTYLAATWAPHKIRVNTLTPGGVLHTQNQTFIDAYSKRIPLARMANPDEIVSAAIFLASDASSYMTGHNLIVDGGLHCW